MSDQLGTIKRFQQRTIRMLQRPSSAVICWLKKVLPTKKEATVDNVLNRSEPDLSEKFTTFCTTTLEPFEQTWVIEKISAYFDEDMVGPPSMCSSFLSPRTLNDFRLFMQFKVRSIENREFVSLIFANELKRKTQGLQTVVYKLSIIDRDGVKRHSKAGMGQFGRPQGRHGWHNFIARDILLDPANGLLPDDKLTIYCEAYLLHYADVPNPNWKCVDSGYTKLDSKFVEWKIALYENGKFTDVVLVFDDGRELRAHKAILASASPLFEVMFNCDWLENSSNRVTITDTSVQLFQQMLQYIYTDKLELTDQCGQLMILADKFQIESLKNLCEESLCLNVSLDNATELLELANTYEATKLKAAVMDLAKRQIKDSVQVILNNPRQTIEAGKFLFALTGDEEKSIRII